MVASNIKIPQKMKNKGLESIEKYKQNASQIKSD